MANLCFCLMGPTAAGKTALAGQLLKHFPFEIVSVDSAMIYREMDIGTAKPNERELHEIPHHLINILNPPESYSAAQFCHDVQRLSQEIHQREKIPLLVGGTMMYFRALQQGLSNLPEADEGVREELLAQARCYGWEFLHQQLEKVDPESALRIHPNDSQRIQRALEVYRITGKPLSSRLANEKTMDHFSFVNLILIPEHRSWLHAQIALRFNHMLSQGLIAEVDSLVKKWHLDFSYPSMRSVGYRQVLNYLAGEYDVNALSEKGIAATRQLAKRQLTWLRHWPEGLYFACEAPFMQQEVIATIAKILDNNR